jgi:hypothetical protein
LDEQHALSASINPISYRRNALEAPFVEEKPSDQQYRQAWVDQLRSIGNALSRHGRESFLACSGVIARR